ncbi:MAG: MFS transporter [Candidatus Moranbacteria bacterium]|nr:MFS transporter [Candidatus Moranbacteria bacterium]
MSKVKLWYLYDFANSFASSVVIFYFPLLLLRGGASDTWIGLATAISTVILLIFYPGLGRRADESQKRRMKYMIFSSVSMLLALYAMGIITNVYAEHYTFFLLFLLCLLYIVFQVSFQGSYVFYTAFMQNFRDTGHNKDRVSSLGMGLGQLGNAVSIGIMGAFVVNSSLMLFGVNGNSLALILGATIFIVLAIPFLIQKVGDADVSRVKEAEKRFTFGEFIKKVFKNKKLFFYLLGYMFVADSIATLQIYMTLYLKNVFGFTERMSSLGGVISLSMLFVTCMLVGGWAHKIIGKNRMLTLGGTVYICAFILFGLAPNVPLYGYLSLSFAGIAYGLFFPLARSLYSDIVPKESQAEYFSSFVIFERAATVIGPVVWVTVFELLGAYPVEYRYRANVMALALTAMLGLYFIKKSFTMKNQTEILHILKT